MLALLGRYGGPAGLRAAGRGQLLQTSRRAYPRGAAELVDQLIVALDEQSVLVPGTAAAETVLPKLVGSLRDTIDQRTAIAAQVEQVLNAHPLADVLTSMPGVGVRTTARILLEVGDASCFPTAGHLAAYAGLAPVTRRSGISIRGEHPPRSGNKHLKRALFLSAFATLRSDPVSRAYYDRRQAEGKRQNAALTCLARRRTDVLYAMIRPSPTTKPAYPKRRLDFGHRDTLGSQVVLLVSPNGCSVSASWESVRHGRHDEDRALWSGHLRGFA